MKRLLTISVALILTASVLAQAPEKMSYQAVIRNSDNKLVSSKTIGMQISILKTSADGTAVYTETQTPKTNANGLVSIEIGGGTVKSGNFAAIDWSKGKYFIKTETDPTGGSNYSITGISQLLSVPYALHAKTANNVTKEMQNLNDVLTLNNSAGNKKISNLAAPTDAQDAVNKAYVDNLAEIIKLDIFAENGITDKRDNTHYKTVRIGKQVWMAENLKYLPSVNNHADGSEDSPGSYYYVYDYNGTNVTTAKQSTNYKTYGVLYNWTAAKQSCPTGWHLPTVADLKTLEVELGISETEADGIGSHGTNQGSQLAGKAHLWNDGALKNNSEFGSTGFAGLPAGYRSIAGECRYIGEESTWWCSTQKNSSEAYYFGLNHDTSQTYKYTFVKTYGFSVRCIRD